MKIKTFKKIFIFGLLSVFLCFCMLGFSACQNGDGNDDSDGSITGGAMVAVGNGETNPEYGADEIAYYRLPGNFWLQLASGDITYNFVKWDGQYFFEGVKNDYPLERKCLIRDGDSFALYSGRVDESDEFVWEKSKGDLSEKDAGKEAYTLLSMVIMKANGNTVRDSVTVDESRLECRKYTITNNAGLAKYWLFGDYDFWVKCEISPTVGGEVNINATCLDTTLTAWPSFINLPQA